MLLFKCIFNFFAKILRNTWIIFNTMSILQEDLNARFAKNN